MKKTLTMLSLLSLTAIAYGQENRVGINTETPRATLDVRETPISLLPSGTPQGVLFPRLTSDERSAFTTNVKEGTMIYNTTLDCVEQYTFRNNTLDWHCMCYCGDDTTQNDQVQEQLAEFSGGLITSLAVVSSPDDAYVLGNTYQKFKSHQIEINYTATQLGKLKGGVVYSEELVASQSGQEIDRNTISFEVPEMDITEYTGKITISVNVDGDGELIFTDSINPKNFSINIQGMKVDITYSAPTGE